MQLTKHDDLPVSQNSTDYPVTLEEVLGIWDKSYDLFTGFSHLAYSHVILNNTRYAIDSSIVKKHSKISTCGT